MPVKKDNASSMEGRFPEIRVGAFADAPTSFFMAGYFFLREYCFDSGLSGTALNYYPVRVWPSAPVLALELGTVLRAQVQLVPESAPVKLQALVQLLAQV
jgi:hypothetical protein